ncbi:MAG TPA: TIGR01459 family HAD-type hydrolase [Methylovirgula sp.]|nr:TIGR01459 family HAD-type hydrolase [Methylovirgula sp.]
MNAPHPKLMPAPPRLLSGLGEIAGAYDLILCDVWGVVHNGVAYFRGAIDALMRFRAKGGTVILITNAPRPSARVKDSLDQLEVSHAAYDAIVSSGDVTISLILERDGLPLGHIGPPRDNGLFTEVERLKGSRLRFVPLEEAPYVVCIGLDDPETETPADYEPRLRIMRARGSEFICANPDIVVEVGNRLFYCAGALAEVYEAMGGKVTQAGKPYPPIYERAFAVAAKSRSQFDRSRVLAIGDAAQTDIKGAQAQGLATLFVTSGIHRAELHPQGADLDAAAVRQFIEGTGVAPMAAIAELVW